MKNYTDKKGTVTCPVIDSRRRNRYVNGEKTNLQDSAYTILQGYEQVEILVAEDEIDAAVQAQIRKGADAGTPVMMTFSDLEITVKAKSQWEIQAQGRATKAVMTAAK